MPRDEEYDDHEDAPRDRPAGDEDDGPRFPGAVRAAGVIWLLFGCIGMFTALLSFTLQAGQGPNNNSGGGCCGLLIPLAFAVVGYQTIRGTAKDTLGNAIGSLVFAVLYAGLAGLLLFFGGQLLQGPGANANGPPGGDPAAARLFVGVVVGLLGLFGLLLGAAGVLALSGRQAYKGWRRAEGLDATRRRRGRDEEFEDDLDDRPRRRDDNR